MNKRYNAVFPWDFEGNALVEDETPILIKTWSSFLWECIHPFHRNYPKYKNPTPSFVVNELAKIAVESCTIYGDKMTLVQWNHLIDNLLSHFLDVKRAGKLRAGGCSISSEYLWYGVEAWHGLKVSSKKVRSAILLKRASWKAHAETISREMMRELKSLYPERWERDHEKCNKCELAISEPIPENFPWCQYRLDTGQYANDEECLKHST